MNEAHLNPHRAPSVGALVKKILALQPDLSVLEIIAIVRQSTLKDEHVLGADIVDESRALELARDLARASARHAELGDQARTPAQR